MDSTNSSRRDELARYVPWAAAALVLVVAVPLGAARGIPAVVLWLAFALMSGAVLLFWESVRLVVDPTAPGDETAESDEAGVPAELDDRKRAALRALRDIEFEHAIGRISDDDYRGLEAKYRAEARAAMRAIDEGLGAYLGKAEALLARIEATGGTDAPAAQANRRESPTAVTGAAACAGCGASNDADAVFCKKCGTRIASDG